MAGTLFFVHGTGVREEGYEQLLRLIKAGVERNSVDVDDVRGVSWGNELGVKVDRLPDVLPEISTKGAEIEPAEFEVTARVWAQLIEDPLFELRIAAVRPPEASATAGLPGQEFPSEKVGAKLKALALSAADLRDAGIEPTEVKQAADQLAVTPELAGAARSFGNENDPDLNQALARSLVAFVIAEHRYDPPGTGPGVAFNGAVRDRLVGAIEAKLNPTPTKGFIFDSEH
jgi:hypothetical protein